MSFALPLAPRSQAPRARAWIVRVVPALLLCAGAALLGRGGADEDVRASAPIAGAPGSAEAPAAEVAGAPIASAPIAGAEVAGLDASAVIGAILVVAGLLFFLPSVLARFGAARARGERRIQVVEARPLGGRKSLLLVEVEGRRLLLGASEAGLASLAELGSAPARHEPARSASPRLEPSRHEPARSESASFESALSRELDANAPSGGRAPSGLARRRTG